MAIALLATLAGCNQRSSLPPPPDAKEVAALRAKLLGEEAPETVKPTDSAPNETAK